MIVSRQSCKNYNVEQNISSFESHCNLNHLLGKWTNDIIWIFWEFLSEGEAQYVSFKFSMSHKLYIVNPFEVTDYPCEWVTSQVEKI